MKHKTTITKLLAASVCCVAAVGGYAVSSLRPPGLAPGNLLKTETNLASQKLIGANHNLKKAKAPEEITPTLYGIVGSSDGIYVASFSAAPDIELNKLYTSNKLAATGGAIYVNEKLYVNVLSSNGVYNTTTQYVFRTTPSWKLLETRENLPYNSSATCMTYDATTDVVYGQFYNDEMENMCWGTLDLNTGESWALGIMNDDLVALAAHPDGKIYGINSMGMFMEINKADGSVRRIGHTDVKPAYMQSAVIDQQTGRFYWAAYTDTGTSGLYEVDIRTGAASFISPFPKNEEIIGLYIEAPAVAGTAPSEVTDVTLDFQQASLSGDVRFKAPATTEDGDPLQGSLTATVFMDGRTWTASAEPGAECSISVTASGEGYHNFYIYTASGNSVSRKINRQLWLGNDTPLPVKNIALTNRDGKAELSWDAPKSGVHGGYVDTDKVTYIVRRYPDNKVTEDVTATSLSEEIASTGMASVHYRIIPVFNGKRGEPADSPEVLFGSHYDVPAVVKFGDRGTFGICNVVDANSDGNTWQWDYSGSAKYSGKKSSGLPADDWIITPAVRLTPGHNYKVLYKIYGKNATYFPQPYEVRMGQGKTVDAMTVTLVKDTLQEGIAGSMQFIERSIMVNVEEAGEYNFGFRTTTTSYNDFFISEIRVEQSSALTSAEAPQQMSAAGAEKGKLEARISMKAPTNTIEGNPLKTLPKIEIYKENAEYLGGILLSREWVLIHTAENVAPGSEVTYIDNEARQGTNVYKAIPYGDDGMAGDEATASCWCGVDVPTSPQKATLTYMPEEDVCILEWDTPQIGTNGGYIDPAGLRYTILEPAYGTALAEDVEGNQLRVNTPKYDGVQYTVSLLVGVTNVAGSSNSVTASNTVIVGNPVPLPMVENFPRRNLNYNWFINGSVLDEGGWNTTQADGVYGDSGFATFQGLSGDEQRLISSKISLKGASNPTLRFFVAGTTNTSDELIIEIAEDYGKEFTPLLTLHAPEGGWQEWTPYEISLKEYTDRDFVHIAFHGKAVGMDCNFALDNITVRDVPAHDLEVSRLTADRREVKVARDGAVKLSAVVENRGYEDVNAQDFTVRFSSEGKTIATLPGVNLASYERHAYEYEWMPALHDADLSSIGIEVSYDADMDLSNNVDSGVEVALRKPECPAVTDLKGEKAPGGFALTWTRPDLSGRPIEYVTDDFESYLNQAIDEAGDWTIHDIDKMPTTTEGYYFQMMGSPMGFIVMDTDEIPLDSETPLSARWPAYSGSKFLAAFAAVGADNDDWLVTPLLSGREQNISFYAMSGLEEYGHEAIEILYSLTGTAPGDFIRLTDKPDMVPSEWTCMRYKLPEGAKYCAVRCVSHNRMGLFIDDFNYESAARPLEITFKGYNVYRNGELLTTEPVKSESFTDTAGAKGVYKVRVVYDLGESADSNVVDTTAGVDAIDTEVSDGSEVWYDLLGRRINKPSAPGVYILNGKKVFVK